jgi:hypothetical protein
MSAELPAQIGSGEHMAKVQAGAILRIASLQLASCQTEDYPPPAAGPDTD